MTERVNKRDLVKLVAERTGKDLADVAATVDATFEEMYQAIKRGESVSLRDFGTFYVRVERTSWVFKFNPSQRLRAALGWSSTYRREQT